MAGMAPTHAVRLSGAIVSSATAAAVQKKSPTLTLGQAQLLVAAVLEQGRMTPARALQIVAYYTERNFIAYTSHRKTRMRRVARQMRRGRKKGSSALKL